MQSPEKPQRASEKGERFFKGLGSRRRVEECVSHKSGREQAGSVTEGQLSKDVWKSLKEV